MKFPKGKGKGRFEDRTGMIVDKGYEDTEGSKPRHRQAKTAGPNDSWVPLEHRNGYHRSRLGKSEKR